MNAARPGESSRAAPWERSAPRGDALRRNIRVLGMLYALSPVLLYLALRWGIPGDGAALLASLILILGVPLAMNLFLIATVLVRMSAGETKVPGRFLLPCLLAVPVIEAWGLYLVFQALMRMIPC